MKYEDEFNLQPEHMVWDYLDVKPLVEKGKLYSWMYIWEDGSFEFPVFTLNQEEVVFLWSNKDLMGKAQRELEMQGFSFKLITGYAKVIKEDVLVMLDNADLVLLDVPMEGKYKMSFEGVKPT